MADRLDNKKDQVVGSVKEAAGKLTGDSQTELKGKTQKESGKLKDKLEDVKDKAAEKLNDLIDSDKESK